MKPIFNAAGRILMLFAMAAPSSIIMVSGIATGFVATILVGAFGIGSSVLCFIMLTLYSRTVARLQDVLFEQRRTIADMRLRMHTYADSLHVWSQKGREN